MSGRGVWGLVACLPAWRRPGSHSMTCMPQNTTLVLTNPPPRSLILRRPANPLDAIIERLGGSKAVAELTGRKSAVVSLAECPGLWRQRARRLCLCAAVPLATSPCSALSWSLTESPFPLDAASPPSPQVRNESGKGASMQQRVDTNLQVGATGRVGPPAQPLQALSGCCCRCCCCCFEGFAASLALPPRPCNFSKPASPLAPLLGSAGEGGVHGEPQAGGHPQ